MCVCVCGSSVRKRWIRPTRLFSSSLWELALAGRGNKTTLPCLCSAPPFSFFPFLFLWKRHQTRPSVFYHDEEPAFSRVICNASPPQPLLWIPFVPAHRPRPLLAATSTRPSSPDTPLARGLLAPDCAYFQPSCLPPPLPSADRNNHHANDCLFDSQSKPKLQ